MPSFTKKNSLFFMLFGVSGIGRKRAFVDVAECSGKNDVRAKVVFGYLFVNYSPRAFREEKKKEK